MPLSTPLYFICQLPLLLRLGLLLSLAAAAAAAGNASLLMGNLFVAAAVAVVVSACTSISSSSSRGSSSGLIKLNSKFLLRERAVQNFDIGRRQQQLLLLGHSNVRVIKASVCACVCVRVWLLLCYIVLCAII